MSEKKSSAEDLAQRIDQLLVVLREISEDLADISKHLKVTVTPTPTTTPTTPALPKPSLRTRTVADVRTIFSKELENMLTFEETEKYIVIKPRQYLGSENFAKIASLVRNAGGEYISAGKESHFRVSREVR
jgi:hypothetical protein